MSRVLIVEDEPQLLKALTINLRARHHEVHTAPDGTTALKTAPEHPPELVILDLGLPDLDGLDVITGLRGWTEVPILVLSGRSDATDKVHALDAGADDYLTKPFSIDELLARLRALNRRGTPMPDTPAVRLGDLTIDLAGKRVTDRDGYSVHLTPTEWALLDKLVRNPERLISQQQLLTDIWGPNYTTETGYLRLYMSQLRRKLEPTPARPRHLITEPGMGYRYQP